MGPRTEPGELVFGLGAGAGSPCPAPPAPQLWASGQISGALLGAPPLLLLMRGGGGRASCSVGPSLASRGAAQRTALKDPAECSWENEMTPKLCSHCHLIPFECPQDRTLIKMLCWKGALGTQESKKIHLGDLMCVYIIQKEFRMKAHTSVSLSRRICLPQQSGEAGTLPVVDKRRS